MMTALVPIAPECRTNPAAVFDRRADADFIAHLIATAAHVPQTRERRRAEPEEALAAYRARDDRPIAPGRTLSRSL